MPLLHKFYQTDFQNGFWTENTILKTDIYQPEVIFIGTYNHGWAWNPSDFFYGRDMYMWPVLGNMFLYNGNHLFHRRNLNNDNPTLDQIFDICERGKIAFADIVKGVSEGVPVAVNNQERYILINNEFQWPVINEERKNVKEYSDTYLYKMGKFNWLDDNVEAITKYINETPSIQHVYFTFKTGTWLVKKKNEICYGLRQGVSSSSIFTPTANGFGVNLPDPFHKRAWTLAHTWIWNTLQHDIPVNKSGYGYLNHNWLSRNGVDPDHF